MTTKAVWWATVSGLCTANSSHSSALGRACLINRTIRTTLQLPGLHGGHQLGLQDCQPNVLGAAGRREHRSLSGLQAPSFVPQPAPNAGAWMTTYGMQVTIIRKAPVRMEA